MLSHSTSTFSSIIVGAAFVTASTSDNMPQLLTDEALLSQQAYERHENTKTSGMPIMYYNHASEDFARSWSMSNLLENNSIEMQSRYKAIERSFVKHSKGFPADKREHFLLLANEVCKLQFNDNVSSYNEYDETIETILKLSDGLTLSISQFLDEDADASAVFSVHRGRTLLVSDEMPVREIVDTINSIIAKFANGTKA